MLTFKRIRLNLRLIIVDFMIIFFYNLYVEVDKGGLENIAKGSAMAFMNKILGDFELASRLFSKVIA